MNDTQSRDGTGLLTIGQAAEIIGVSIATIRRWERAQKIRALRSSGGQRRFERAEVDRVAAEYIP